MIIHCFTIILYCFNARGWAQLHVIQPSAISHFGTIPQNHFQNQKQQQIQYLSQQQQDQINIQQQVRNLLLMRACPTRPIGCTLTCPNGFAWGTGGLSISENKNGGSTASCLCICQIDPCLDKICDIGEICVSNQQSVTKCISLEASKRELYQLQNQLLQYKKITPLSDPDMNQRQVITADRSNDECPRLVGGMCTDRCSSDADCQQADDVFPDLKIFLKCCSNGCGHECVLAAVTAASVVSSLSNDKALENQITPFVSQSIQSIAPVKPANQDLAIHRRPIQPSKPKAAVNKFGQCPLRNFLRDRSRCSIKCTTDGDCNGVEKCCDSACGKVCAPPEKASGCVHLLSAIERLDNRYLANGFVPSCSPRGNFNPIQCDADNCWCVGPETGNEIYGTKLPKRNRTFLNCIEIRNCGPSLQQCVMSGKKCAFGFRTDDKGCPLTNCACRNVCEDVKCDGNFYECQLVEPDCARLPCLPVPKCLLNPCPTGQPMKLQNDVTALCKQSEQCWDGFWCHQIGYNELGFCCPKPNIETRPGKCRANSATSYQYRNNKTICTSNCKSDKDCSTPSKCCFDGCGLKCTLDFAADSKQKSTEDIALTYLNQQNPSQNEKLQSLAKNYFHKGYNGEIFKKTSTELSVELANKEILANYPKLAKCPSDTSLKRMFAVLHNEKKCFGDVSECLSDADCPGMQMCCGTPSAKPKTGECRICVYSQSTTRCLHQAITYDCYKTSREAQLMNSPAQPLRCSAPYGDFDEIQCNNEYCFCIDRVTGIKMSNTRVTLQDIRQFQKLPTCSNNNANLRPTNSCPLLHCHNTHCPSNEFVRDENGCTTCECANACKHMQCADDEVCILAQVECISLTRTKCPAQPRCVKNICGDGDRPFMALLSNSEQSVVAEQCIDTCPTGYWCNNVGLAGLGGLCCPQTSFSTIQIAPSTDLAKCPQQLVLLLPIQNIQNDLCQLQCRSNEDCNEIGKINETIQCCFNGCGTVCVTVNSASKLVENQISLADENERERIGECVIPINRAFGINKYKTNSNCCVYNALRRSNGSVSSSSKVDECSYDGECPVLQKCCLDGCSGARRCQYAAKMTACLHLKAALHQISTQESSRVRCTKDGLFEMIQCDDMSCWCVDAKFGDEIEGTRVSASQLPSCQYPHKCKGVRCASKRCLHGFKKDWRGCNTCECANPCENIQCPSSTICIPEPVECLGSEEEKLRCPHVPKCIANFCLSADTILLRDGIFRPEICQNNDDCPKNYFCRIFNNENGFCCFGNTPVTRNGRCPALADWTISSSLTDSAICDLKCTQDDDCMLSSEKCCFNGCGLSCLPSLNESSELKEILVSKQQKLTQEIINSPKSNNKIMNIGECPYIEVFSNKTFCAYQNSHLKNCRQDDECVENQKCCSNGCTKHGELLRVCMLASVTTHCLHARASALLLLKPFSNNVFLPSCTSDGEYDKIQRHNGMSWCVDTFTGREIYGTKSPSILLTDCRKLKRVSCPILSCTFECQYGYETDNSGCQLCACKNPCRDMRCPPNNVCRMTRVKCISPKNSESKKQSDQNCSAYVPRCILNTCPKGEPFEDVVTKRLFDCNDSLNQTCPVGWHCLKFGMNSAGYCCSGLVQQKRLHVAARLCPPVPQILSIDVSLAKQSVISNSLACRISENCINQDETCCFNGEKTICVRLNDLTSMSIKSSKEFTTQERDFNDAILPENDDANVLLQNNNTDECPTNSFSNPGCQSDCVSDEECQNRNVFLRCCAFGCGRRCQFAYGSPSAPSTVCLNYLAAVMAEADKILLEKNENNGARLVPSSPFVDRVTEFVARNEVQCLLNGLFRRIQCSIDLRQCWCVDAHSGIELLGTRVNNSDGIEPNCYERHTCLHKCVRESTHCPHGLRLNAEGCPISSACDCRQACDDFECVRDNEICVPKRLTTNCGSKSCVSVPTCVVNPCGTPAKTVYEELIGRKVAEICDAEISNICGSNAKCEIVNAIKSANHDKIGICCTFNENMENHSSIKSNYNFSTDFKVGICPSELGMQMSVAALSSNTLLSRQLSIFDPKDCNDKLNQCESDNDCVGTQKCCESMESVIGCKRKACVTPVRATNCMNLLAAIQRLRISRISNNLHMPSCDRQNKAFVSNQCSSDGWCWCVDSITGQELLGTRRFQPVFDICGTNEALSAARQCPIVCDQARLLSCPFGVEADQNGCPKTSNCQCRSPCSSIQCSFNQICILQFEVCQEEICMPVPVCKPNPCLNNQAPARNTHTNSHMICLFLEKSPQNLSNCPIEHFCTGFDKNQFGVCCPGKEPILQENRFIANSHKPDSRLHSRYRFELLCLKGNSSNSLPNLSDYFRLDSDIKDIVSSNNLKNDAAAKKRQRFTSCSTRSQHALCDQTHYCVTEENRLDDGVCCPTQNYICSQPMDAGYGVNGDETSNIKSSVCDRTTSARFYYDNALNTCAQFIYGGCGGNLNNFLYKFDCEEFCFQRGSVTFENEAKEEPTKFYAIQFSFNQPNNEQLKHKERKQEFERMLKDYIAKNYDVNVTNLSIKDDNLVHFLISTKNGAETSNYDTLRKKAETITKNVSSGNFHIWFENELYHAEPQSLSSRQEFGTAAPTSTDSDSIWDSDSNGTFFWLITVSSLLFALVIVVILCCGYNFLRIRSTDSSGADSLYRDVSPTYGNEIRAYSNQPSSTTLTRSVSSPQTETCEGGSNNHNVNQNGNSYSERVNVNPTNAAGLKNLRINYMSQNSRPFLPGEVLSHNSRNPIHYPLPPHHNRQQGQRRELLLAPLPNTNFNTEVIVTRRNRITVLETGPPRLLSPSLSSFDEDDSRPSPHRHTVSHRVLPSNVKAYDNKH